MDRVVIALAAVAAVLYFNSNGRFFPGATKPIDTVEMQTGRYRDEHSPFTPA